MRVLVLAIAAAVLGACSSSTDGDGGEAGGSGGSAAGGAGGSGAGGTGGVVTALRLDVPSIDVPSGTELTNCWHTTLPGGVARGVKSWASSADSGVLLLTVRLVASGAMADGTVEPGCDVLDVSAGQAVAFLATGTAGAMSLPPGTAEAIAAGQRAIVGVHAVNATASAITVGARVDADLVSPGESFDPVSSFVALRADLVLPAQASATAGGSCDVPQGASFVGLTTHTHGLATLARVTDGEATLVETTDWENPAVGSWDARAFAGKLGYHCEYTNTTNRIVRDGGSFADDERCMAVGWFFPATAPRVCVNDVLVPE